MDIETSVRLSADEQQQLLQVLGGVAADLPQKLAALGKAALREYAEMLLGQTTVRSPEVREQRLLNIILEAYDGHVPSEAEIGQMFGLTGLGARSLVRSVLSRHRLRMQDSARTAARQVLAACDAEENGFRRVSISNPIIVEYLNDMLADLNGVLKRIGRETRTGTSYLIPEDSFVALNGELNP